ncbi:MAG: hypothetical protein ACF8LL_14915 [Phycisphaerales bacterium]
MTLLEAVCAVAMLAIVAASMFGTIDFLMTRQKMQERELAAMELANRLMLQHLDDPRELADDVNLPLRYNPGPHADLFRWDMETVDVEVELDEAATLLDEDALRFAQRRLEHVTVRVWLSEHSGGTYRPDGSPVVVELSRIVDPFAMRTPEQVRKIFQDPGRIGELFGEGGG